MARGCGVVPEYSVHFVNQVVRQRCAVPRHPASARPTEEEPRGRPPRCQIGLVGRQQPAARIHGKQGVCPDRHQGRVIQAHLHDDSAEHAATFTGPARCTGRCTPDTPWCEDGAVIETQAQANALPTRLNLGDA